MDSLYFLIPSYILKLVSLTLCATALYCYRKLQILKKPPGQLILIQQISLVIMQLIELVDLILINMEQDYRCAVINYFLISSYSVCSIYEVCIAYEILSRLKFTPMGQNYNRRKKIYHIVCFIGTLELLISAQSINFKEDGNIICSFGINLYHYTEK